jgi:phosphotransferase system HPr-like phosphotransfer protein
VGRHTKGDILFSLRSIMRKEIDLIPSELRAIEIHKYYLSEKEGREVSFEEAMIDFIDNYEADFLSKKQVEDNQEQNQEILKYRWIESEKEGHDIGKQKAALDWIEQYGCIWREEKESLEENGFVESSVVIENRGGASIVMEKLSDIAHYFDCDIYIHQHRMKNYNFKFFGKKEYLNVKSILSPKYLEATHGESIELIATGGRARDALEASARFIRESPPCIPAKD